MNFACGLLAVSIGTATVAVLVQPQFAVALTPEEVNKIAYEITVRIDGPGGEQNNGSGTIVSRQGDVYTVLTAAHVTSAPGQYAIQTSDGKQHAIASGNIIEPLPGVDLAQLQFTSEQNYRVAERGDSDRVAEGQRVHFAGYPKPTRVNIGRSYRFFSVNLTGRLQEPTKKGYALIYDGDALPGMSGGPVLDEDGRAIGIHGETDLHGTNGPVGNYAVPINVFQNPRADTLFPTPDPNPTWLPTSIPLPRTLPSIAYANLALANTLRGTHSSVAISPDGLRVATGDTAVQIWDRRAGNLIRTLKGDRNRVLSVAISPDGKTLASSSDFGEVEVWNLGTGEKIRTLKLSGGNAVSLAINPDGQTLASSSGNGFELWNLATGERLRAIAGHLEMVSSLAFSPDGKNLASGSADKTIKLWDVKTGELLGVFSGHKERVRSVAFSPEGRTLVSASDDGTIKIWNPQTGQLVRTIHVAWKIYSVAISPDRQIIASGGERGSRLWNLQTGKLFRNLGEESGSVAFSRDGRTLIVGGRTIQIWRVLERPSLQQSPQPQPQTPAPVPSPATAPPALRWVFRRNKTSVRACLDRAYRAMQKEGFTRLDKSIEGSYVSGIVGSYAADTVCNPEEWMVIVTGADRNIAGRWRDRLVHAMAPDRFPSPPPRPTSPTNSAAIAPPALRWTERSRRMSLNGCVNKAAWIMQQQGFDKIQKNRSGFYVSGLIDNYTVDIICNSRELWVVVAGGDRNTALQWRNKLRDAMLR